MSIDQGMVCLGQGITKFMCEFVIYSIQSSIQLYKFSILAVINVMLMVFRSSDISSTYSLSMTPVFVFHANW